MKLTVRLHNFHGHNPHDYVALAFHDDGTWKREGFSKFECPAQGRWISALAQETNLSSDRIPLLCILHEFNLKPIGRIPNEGDYSTLSWHGEDHIEVVDGQWTVMEKEA